MYPLDQLTNACQPVTLAGRSFPVRQLQLREWGEFQAWLKSACPSPMAVAIKAFKELRDQDIPIPKDLQDSIFRQAQEETRRWPPRVGTQEWLRSIDGIEGGGVHFIQIALRAGGTDVSEEEAYRIEKDASGDELGDLMRVCLKGEYELPKASGETNPPVSAPTIGGNGSSISAKKPVGITNGSDG